MLIFEIIQIGLSTSCDMWSRNRPKWLSKSPYVTELWNTTKIQNVGHESDADVADVSSSSVKTYKRSTSSLTLFQAR